MSKPYISRKFAIFAPVGGLRRNISITFGIEKLEYTSAARDALMHSIARQKRKAVTEFVEGSPMVPDVYGEKNLWENYRFNPGTIRVFNKSAWPTR